MKQSTSHIFNDAHLLDLGKHQNPHLFLGLHAFDDYHKLIRFFAPKRQELRFEYCGQIVEAKRGKFDGEFSYLVPVDTTKFDYRVLYPNGMRGYDPYNFSPVFSLVDSDQFNWGRHQKLYEVLGSHRCVHGGVEGVKFAVWAPNAQAVSLVGDLNGWKEFDHPMRKVCASGVWELFIPGCDPFMCYKYAIKTVEGEIFLKSDPFAHAFELRPNTASMVTSSGQFVWQDQVWMEKRKRHSPLNGPMNVYEMHFGSWQKKKDGAFPNYREMAGMIVPYLKEMGYTHLEILPLTEHPLDESWGYQSTGYFAPTSRYGTMEDFQYFVNHLHINHIGIILDWSPGHFPNDDFALARFDGTAVYEIDDELMGIHPEWGSLLFNYHDPRVRNFLLASALFWIDKFHIDGIRVDAVESMMFLNYAREEGGWKPNALGGNENLGAMTFLKELNQVIHEEYPGVITIAEDASLKSNLTQPVEWGGLGFDLKWNMGWMNETLRFMQRDPIYRKYHMDELLGSYERAFQERFILPISHDEVVHEKGSLLEKMPLGRKEKFDQVRLYYSAALTHPGKNLFFMGCELAQKCEWNLEDGVHWHLLEDPSHRQLYRFVRDANHFLLDHPALWQIDFHQKGFEWIDYNDYNHSVISYLRRGIDETLACVHNFTKSEFDEYIIRLPNVLTVKEVLNSDEICYGGAGRVNRSAKILPDRSGFVVQMPSLATMIFSVVLKANDH